MMVTFNLVTNNIRVFPLNVAGHFFKSQLEICTTMG